MYTPNLKSARESKYLALKKKKKEGKIKTVFIKGDQNLSKWPYDLTQIDFKLVKSVSEFRVPVENQQLSVSRKQDQRRREEMPFIHISGTLWPGGTNSCVLFPVLVCAF